MKVSVVVPVRNEEDNILPLVSELASLSGKLNGLEVLLVDDGSTDGTWVKVQEAGSRYAAVRGVSYFPSRGQSYALLTGLIAAGGDTIVTMDGDMQNDPADIPAMLAELKGADVVCGYRRKRMDSWSRRAGSKIANTVRNWFTRDGMRDTCCGLKAFKRECVTDLPHVNGVHRFMPAYFGLNGRKIVEVPVEHRPRTAGVSKYTNLKRLPAVIFDLIGFAWYRRRFQTLLPARELHRTPG